MKKMWFKLFPIFSVVVMTGCSTVPLTGRKQLTLVPAAQIRQSSFQSYGEVLKESKLSEDAEQTAMIKRVGERISVAVDRYMRENGMGESIDGFAWEFNLIEDDVPNAWCMPGGKVAFYTGILPFTQDETGVAVVMGHEIAHAVAGHGRERVSHQLLQQGGGAMASYFGQDSEYHDAIMTVYGYGTQLGIVLPYSRTHELEADRLGLIFMALAGYDPGASIPFWQRMAQGKEGAPPEFLSTHPSDDSRISRLREVMPDAMQYYRPR